MDYALPSVSFLILPIACCYIVMLFNWKLGLLQIFSILLLVYADNEAQRDLRVGMEAPNGDDSNGTSNP